MSKRVRVGANYVFVPCGMDAWDTKYKALEGVKVLVVNLPGCPPANTMGHCYINHLATGSFIGLVHTGSLVSEREYAASRK